METSSATELERRNLTIEELNESYVAFLADFQQLRGWVSEKMLPQNEEIAHMIRQYGTLEDETRIIVEYVNDLNKIGLKTDWNELAVIFEKLRKKFHKKLSFFLSRMLHGVMPARLYYTRNREIKWLIGQLQNRAMFIMYFDGTLKQRYGDQIDDQTALNILKDHLFAEIGRGRRSGLI